MVGEFFFGRIPGLGLHLWLSNSGIFIVYAMKKEKNIVEVWENEIMKLSFRRTFSNQMMLMWDELKGVVSSLVLKEELDAPIWNYSSSGIYSSQSCYAIISFRGVTPVYIPAVWSVRVPQKIHMFLWLLSHNKLATVDNLNKKGLAKPESCMFCAENENISHIFFGCVVARVIWKDVL
jgi:hypothetical protein